MEKTSYYSQCDCGQVLEGEGEFDREDGTLYGVDCPKCGLEFCVLDWFEKCETCDEFHPSDELCGFEGEEEKSE